nr:uncharacterized protein I206_03126 [Kwoniella pini CBS 10737]OCF51061.1 hypothetical protein I206_03126 [Kwoniella pini CBS 10737]
MGIRLDDIESGPSSHPSFPPLSSYGSLIDDELQEITCQCEICKQQSTFQPRRRRNATRQYRMNTANLLSLPAFLIPFLPSTSAAPPPTRSRRFPRSPLPKPTPIESYSPIVPRDNVEADPTSTFTIKDHRNVKYLTSVVTPSVLPTNNVYVDETVLPYLLSRHEDGSWTRAEGGWSLYGRQVATPTTSPILADDGGSADAAESSVNAGSYAVESVLPNGWGVSSNRTSIYKVPLISIASVILSTGIVALIIFIVLSRRKEHRKRKRAKERIRRKALAAAGIKEEDLNSSAKEAMFKEKLNELEAQHSAKKKKKSGQIGVAKSKVRVWNQRIGMRRRKKAARDENIDDGEHEGEVRISAETEREERNENEEDKPVEDVDNQSPSPIPSLDEHDDQAATSRSSSDITRRSSPGDDGQSATSTSQIDNDLHAQIGGSANEAQQSIVPHFPPAYRPASVRSLPRHTPSSSSSAGPSHPQTTSSTDIYPTIVSGTEKTQAPGYYPAPATEDGEIALAIASRSEGKSRMIEPPTTEEEDEDSEESARIRHIATDDKRVLERMRLGASAPPVNRESSGDGEAVDGAADGPSAPAVKVDQDGFEEVDETQLQVSSEPPYEITSFTGTGDLPEPPRLNSRLSSRLNGISSSLPLDTSHLLPSAPPTTQALDLSLDIPSAPPMLDEGEEADIPSAPMFELGEDSLNEDSGETTSSTDQSTLPSSNEFTDEVRPHEGELLGLDHTATLDQEQEQEQEVENSSAERRDSELDNSTFSNALPVRSGSGSNPLFLPRYEP